MRLIVLVSLLCLVAIVAAQKHLEENVDTVEAESKEHSSKKYSRDYQKENHHGHKHKKPHHDTAKVPKAQKAAAEVPEPEPELDLQPDVHVKVQQETHLHKDRHLQDLAFEEEQNQKASKRRAHHHGAHQAEVVEKQNEGKLFEQEPKVAVEEKVIEDSFAPLKETKGKKNKSNEKKGKGKNKNGKNKNKDKKGKSKNGKNKNKDKNTSKKW